MNEVAGTETLPIAILGTDIMVGYDCWPEHHFYDHEFGTAWLIVCIICVYGCRMAAGTMVDKLTRTQDSNRTH